MEHTPALHPSNPPNSYPIVPNKPIIYQQNKPNFEEDNKRSSLVKKLLELDLGFHLLVTILLVIVIAGLVSGVFFPKTSISKNTSQSSTSSSDLIIAAPNTTQKAEVSINQQILSVDKAFNSNPSSIKLTVSGKLRKEVFGFLPYWTIDKASDLDIRLLTSVSYFGLEVGANGEILKSSPTDNGVTQAWNGWNDPKTIAFIRKAKKARIKTYLTLKSFNNDSIERLMRSDQAQQTLITNALYQVNAKDLDGLNIDFEYVGTPPEGIRDKFSLFISNLNQELKRQNAKAILTIDTYATAALETKLFDITILAGHSDGLIIMGYDFHTSQSSNAGPIAPIGGDGMNLTLALDGYLEKVPPEKIILAVPYYGYAWPTKDNKSNAVVVGNSSDVLALSYAEIMDGIRKYSIQWDDISKTPWFSFVDTESQKRYVVHFENTRSLGIKYDLVNTKGFQGIGIWSLGLDGRNTDLEQLIADKFGN